jgi:hypothetical protein
MGEYHALARAHSASSRPQLAPVPPQSKKGAVFSLAERYNVPDMTDFSNSPLCSAEQTIDEEYTNYITGGLESRDISDARIVTFWEVRTLAAFMLASDELIMP